MQARDVVVGVDGAAPSRAALRWAVAEVGRGGGRLRVLLAYGWRPGPRLEPGHDLDDLTGAQADALCEEAVATVRAAFPGIAVVGTTVPARPTGALVNAADGARMVVVGSRGIGGFASLTLGSVGLGVATHARCPVAVVRGRADADSGLVAVAVDGSPSAMLAVRLAVGQAARRGCGVLAVRAFPAESLRSRNHAWVAAGEAWLPASLNPRRSVEHGVDDQAAGRRREELREQRRDELVTMVSTAHGGLAEVPVRYEIAEGPAAEVLIDLSRRAQLIVVGTRGLGGFAGLLLGSTSQRLMHHADCPVLIARPGVGNSTT